MKLLPDNRPHIIRNRAYLEKRRSGGFHDVPDNYRDILRRYMLHYVSAITEFCLMDYWVIQVVLPERKSFCGVITAVFREINQNHSASVFLDFQASPASTAAKVDYEALRLANVKEQIDAFLAWGEYAV